MNMINYSIIYTLLIICFTLPANATMYHWVDKDSVSHFSNVAPADKANAEKKAEVKTKYIPVSPNHQPQTMF